MKKGTKPIRFHILIGYKSSKEMEHHSIKSGIPFRWKKNVEQGNIVTAKAFAKSKDGAL